MGERPLCVGGPYSGIRPDWAGIRVLGPTVTLRPGQRDVPPLWTYELEDLGTGPIWRYRQMPGVRAEVGPGPITAPVYGSANRATLPAGSYPVLGFLVDSVPGDWRDQLRVRVDHGGRPWLLTLGEQVWIDPESVDG